MARGELMKKLLTNYGRDGEFRAVAKQITLEEEQKNNCVLARSLRHTLNSATLANVRSSKQSPSRKLASLIPFPNATNDLVERVEPVHLHKDVILPHANTRISGGLLQEYRRFGEIRCHGLAARVKLLFCGPPGCGKTLCAEIFAAELGLPLFVVKPDRLTSPYLGGTIGNVRKIFGLAKRQPCVLSLDKFDVLIRSCDDSAEYNELRRVVNSLLLFVDRMQPCGFMITATDLDSSLDPAIWRRFDEVIWFDKSDQALIERFLNTKFKNVATNFDLDKYVDRLEGYSFAEIKRVCIQTIKAPLIARRRGIVESDFAAAIADESRRRAGRARPQTSQ